AASRFEALPAPPMASDRCLPYAVLHQGIRAGRLWAAAVSGRQVVGFALADIVAHTAFLSEIDVLPAYGRRGIGRALIERVEAWARETGFDRLSLTTFRDIPWNGPYYARLGFRELTEEQLSDDLRAVLAAERGHVLAGWVRVAMTKALRGDLLAT
ncbi:MAG: GNAT family N-acetyltransferase, partial [Rhodothermales bacterium]|nr:GNAT family N-acetyltransferase [Rhodothermales bacterium]